MFLHGYVYHELFNVLLHKKGFRNKLGALITATMLKSAVSTNTIDLYVSPSLSVCEANKIADNFVLLPQFIFPEEFRALMENARALKKDCIVRVVAYTSYADSPRLLDMHHLIVLAQVLERMTKRKFELIIVEPKGGILSTASVKIVRPMPHPEFLSLLASADLYIERGIDEDLGRTVLEAMVLGTLNCMERLLKFVNAR